TDTQLAGVEAELRGTHDKYAFKAGARHEYTQEEKAPSVKSSLSQVSSKPLTAEEKAELAWDMASNPSKYTEEQTLPSTIPQSPSVRFSGIIPNPVYRPSMAEGQHENIELEITEDEESAEDYIRRKTREIDTHREMSSGGGSSSHIPSHTSRSRKSTPRRHGEDEEDSDEDEEEELSMRGTGGMSSGADTGIDMGDGVIFRYRRGAMD
ncbi:unnamed protein product, partial [marine sediment metagenome]